MHIAVKLLAAFLSLSCALSAVAKTEVLIRGTYTAQDNAASFQQKGISHQRFDGDGIHLSQAVISSEHQVTNNWSVAGVLNAYSDGERRAGLSQFYVKYRPLTASSIKPEVKVGMFYPALSAENTDIGWLSPHFLTNSAINSWIGEELRTGGIEFSLRQNGRQVRSNWSWKVLASLFKGNDTTGTLLSWRGFALHDRQSLLNDRVNFAPIPWVVNENGLGAPAWTDPFREIDTRFGYYVGAHLAHKRNAEAKYYFYDNNADPTILDPDRIYAWHTRFHSLTLRYMANKELTIFSQFLAGNTLMGSDIVDNDFLSAYVAAAYEMNQWTFAARADWYQVIDRDQTMYDPNDSNGYALTLTTRYDFRENMAVTAEWQTNKGEQDNLTFFQNGTRFTENLLQVALTMRF